MAQSKTLKDIKNLAGKPAPYPDFTVKVKVVKVGHSANFTSSSGEDMTILNFSVADATDCMMATLNDVTKIKLITEGKSLHLRNFVLRNNKIVLTKVSKVMMCGQIEVPTTIKEQAEYLVTPPSPKKTIPEIRKMPARSNVTLVGKIVKDEGIRKVKVGGTDTDIHTVQVQNDGQQINVSLWRENSEVPLHVGQFVEITHCITGQWQSQTQLNSTRNTTIKQIDTPETSVTGTVEGLSIEENVIEMAVQTTDGSFEDLVVERDLFLAALPEDSMKDEDTLEETLTGLIPFNVVARTKGNEVSSLQFLNERPE